MNHHNLKIWPQHYNNVLAGTKTFEIRVNDRGFQKGDTCSLEYFNPKDPQDFNNYVQRFQIGDVYPIDDERVVFSLLPIPKD